MIHFQGLTISGLIRYLGSNLDRMNQIARVKQVLLENQFELWMRSRNDVLIL